MLRFLKENMATVDGVEIYPIISLVIFVTFFAGLVWWVMRSDKKRIKELSELPIQD